MNEYIFLNKLKQPTEKELAELASLAHKFLNEIRDHITGCGLSFTEEWKYYSKKAGWTKKLLVNKRNLFFLTPLKTGPRISFIFGDKGVQRINDSILPQHIKDEINGAKKYAEGRGLGILVKNKTDLRNVLTLLDIKIKG